MTQPTYTPILIDGKYWVVKDAPDKIHYIYGDGHFHIEEYEHDLATCERIPTLSKHFDYWKSKEGQILKEGEFEVKDNITFPAFPYVIPNITTEHNGKLFRCDVLPSKNVKYSGRWEFLHDNQWRKVLNYQTKYELNKKMGLIDDDSPEIIHMKDNGDAWDEAEQLSREFADSENQQGANAWARTDLHDWWLARFNYLKQNYSISKK